MDTPNNAVKPTLKARVDEHLRARVDAFLSEKPHWNEAHFVREAVVAFLDREAKRQAEAENAKPSNLLPA